MTDAEMYRAEWATLTGRSEREVYVPEALRDFELKVGARVTSDEWSGTVLSVASDGLARVRWDDNGSISHERVDENGETI